MERPKRMYELRLTIGADDLKALRSMLNEIGWTLDGEQLPMPYSSVSGGHSGSYILDIEYRPEQTHDAYFEQLHQALREPPETA